jgi:hypothetical protein
MPQLFAKCLKTVAKFGQIGIARTMSFSTSRIAAGYSLDDISPEFRVVSTMVRDLTAAAIGA